MRNDVFLITVDCLRPDYLGAYNLTRRQTPVIDALARDAAIFTQAVCHMTCTTPALASLLTGAYPLHTGVRLLLGQLCDPNITTVAEYARRAGYTTGAFPSLFILNSTTGLDRGFDQFREVSNGIHSGRGGCWQTGDRLNAGVDRFLSDAGKQPVFCWIHYFDVHDAHLDKSVPVQTSYARDLRHKIDGLCLGGLQDVLRRHGRLDNAAFILTADHGECLFQHGQRGHGQHVYDSVLRVPLIIKWPGLTNARTQIDSQVRHVDVAATLLDLWNVPRTTWPAYMDGRSLLPLVRGELLAPVVSYAEANPRQIFSGDIKTITRFERAEIQAVRSEEHKLIINENGERELYDLLDDPLEMANRIQQLPEIADALAGRLAALTETGTATHASVPVAAEDEALVIQLLRDLGYVA